MDSGKILPEVPSGEEALCSNPTMRILILEDDDLLFEGIAEVLIREGHTADQAVTLAVADFMLGEGKYALAVFDIGVPTAAVFELLRRLRARESNIAVLVIAAAPGSVGDRIRCFDLGADDYLSKPFAIAEFHARVRALLRRRVMPALRLSVRNLTVDIDAKRFKVQGELVGLSAKEWFLLELFLSRPGMALSKKEILRHLYGSDKHVNGNRIEVYVSRLRAKIARTGAKIRTIRGIGYVWESEEK